MRDPEAVTILPEQAKYIAKLTAFHNCAVGVVQDGSVLALFVGDGRTIFINAQGQEITYTRKRKRA